MMRQLLEDARITKAILKDIYMECDGFYVYGPLHFVGYLDEWGLRRVAKVLEDLNWSWDQQINDYCDSHK